MPKSIFINTALQSTGALVAMETLGNNIGHTNIKHEAIAIGASILVQVIKWSYLKWIKPLFDKSPVFDYSKTESEKKEAEAKK